MVRKTLMALLVVSLVVGIEGCGKDKKKSSGGGNGGGGNTATKPAAPDQPTDPTARPAPTPPAPGDATPPTPGNAMPTTPPPGTLPKAGGNPPGTVEVPVRPSKTDPPKRPVTVEEPKPPVVVEPPKPKPTAGGTVTEAEAVVKKMLGGFSELTETLKTITDAPTAQAAKPKLVKITTDMAAVKAEADKMEDALPKDVENKLEAKYKPALEKQMVAFQAELQRLIKLNNPEIMKVVQESMKAMSDE